MPKLSFRNFEGVLESGGVVPHVEGYDPEFVGVHFGERGYILERGGCILERGGAFWREGGVFWREGVHFGERGGAFWREGVCFRERVHFGERGGYVSERGVSRLSTPD